MNRYNALYPLINLYNALYINALSKALPNILTVSVILNNTTIKIKIPYLTCVC